MSSVSNDEARKLTVKQLRKEIDQLKQKNQRLVEALEGLIDECKQEIETYGAKFHQSCRTYRHRIKKNPLANNQGVLLCRGLHLSFPDLLSDGTCTEVRLLSADWLRMSARLLACIFNTVVTMCARTVALLYHILLSHSKASD